MAIPDYARTNFNTLLRAAGAGNLLSYATATDTSFSNIEVRVVPENVTNAPKTPIAATREPQVEEKLLITRRGERETMIDVQTLLGELGFDAGVPDGAEAVYFGGDGPARDGLAVWSEVTGLRLDELIAVAGSKAVRTWTN